MKPTPKLRFVERIQVQFEPGANTQYGKRVRVLQQWWEKKEWSHDTEIVVDSEWRDVPLEK